MAPPFDKDVAEGRLPFPAPYYPSKGQGKTRVKNGSREESERRISRGPKRKGERDSPFREGKGRFCPQISGTWTPLRVSPEGKSPDFRNPVPSGLRPRTGREVSDFLPGSFFRWRREGPHPWGRSFEPVRPSEETPRDSFLKACPCRTSVLRREIRIGRRPLPGPPPFPALSGLAKGGTSLTPFIH